MNRRRFEDEMDDELRHHIECYVADLIRSGVAPAEAKRRAHIEFGSMEARKDECRQAWGWQRLDELRADLRLALRAIRHNPGFAATAVLSLALGIGASTAIFGVFDAALLRLLPVHDPDRLVFVQIGGSIGRDGPPYPLFELIRDQARSFESISAFSPANVEITADRGREMVRGMWVSENFFETLGVRPLMGRTLSGPDTAIAVISRAYWRQRFGGDPAIVGRTVYLNQQAATIVGVAPSEGMSLEPGRPIDIAIPMALADPAKKRDQTSLWSLVVARLKPSVSAEQARAQTDTLFRAYIADMRIPPDIRKRLYDHMSISPAGKGLGGLREQFSKPLTALMVLAGLVLLASGVNVTNLMLAKAMAHQRDFALQLALGAGRGRLVRQNVTEALVLVAAAAAIGLFLAHLGQTALASFFANSKNPIVLDLTLNGRVFLFTLSLGTLSALAVGIAPAIRAAKLDPATSLHGGSRTMAGNRLGRMLVLVQVALSMVLLAGAGLFMQSLRHLESVDVGFAREGILTMEMTSERDLRDAPDWPVMQAALIEQIRQIPGVRSAGWATMNPHSGRDRGAIIDVPGFVPGTDKEKQIHLAAISPEHFETLGIPMLLGRGFTTGDHRNSLKVAILNETAAKFYLGNTNPIGHKIKFTNYPGNPSYEVVGVVRSTIHDNVRQPAARFIYLPIPQSVEPIRRLALAVRGDGDALHLAAPVRRLMPSLSILYISTMEKDIGQALYRERLLATLSTAFGAIALVLAAIGLYGILAYAVTRRTNEIGVRMALGATRTGVVWMLLREAFALAGGGILIGVPAVLALGRIAESSLYGVEPADPLTLAVAALLLFFFAALAAAVPGRRASLLDPTIALRRE